MASKEFFRKLNGWFNSEISAAMNVGRAAILERWLELTEQLGSSLSAYQSAMDVRMSGRELVLVLKDKPALAKLVEFGMAPHDMRDTLLRENTRSIRVSKSGHLYLFVPLRKTSRTIVDLGGSSVYRAAQKLKEREALPAGLADKLQPFHATDPLAGLVRIPNSSDSGGSTYMTWRTISQAGRPWMHRGIQARNLMQQVAREAPMLVANALKRR